MINPEKQNIILSITGDCTNDCLMCIVSAPNRLSKTKNREDILKEITEKKREGYKTIHFTGGEPTCNKHLLEFISVSKDLGYYRIEMSSNARCFKDRRVVDEFIDAGLTGLTTSFHGDTAKIHDSVTRIPGSFNETITALENFLSIGGVELSAATVPMTINYNKLKEIADLTLKLGIDKWSLLDLKPVGRAAKAYQKLVAKKADLAKEIARGYRTFSQFGYIGVFDYNWCLFPKELNNLFFLQGGEIKENCKIDPKMERPDIGDTIGLNEDESKTYIPICQDCEFKGRCKGVWKAYVKVFGTNDIKKFEDYNLELE